MISAKPRYFMLKKYGARFLIPRVGLLALVFCIVFMPGSSVDAAGKTGGAPKKTAASPANPVVQISQPAPAKYLGKNYIDSTVMAAIYLINDAASTAGVGFRQKEAIAQARRIAGELRAEYRGDPNERYALWKINELEWLILLEEKDLVLDKMNQGLAGINQLISAYNTEIAKPRPDFRMLSRLHSQISEISPSQAKAMASSMAKRSTAVSRECLVVLEKALLNNSGLQTNETFKYCLRNRTWLAFSNDKFEQLEARVSAMSRSKDEFAQVKKEADQVPALIAQKRLGEGRTVLGNANSRLNEIRSFVPEGEASQMTFRLMRLEGDLGRCEDSLLEVNCGILKSSGVPAASRYLETVLRPAGVSNEKIAVMDQKIIAVNTPSTENTRIKSEIDAVTTSAESGGPDVFGQMEAVAKKKARLKQDSINAVAAKLAEQEAKKNRVYAKRVAAEIYKLIEKKRQRVAHDFFFNKKQYLRQNLSPDAFAMLEGTVKQVVDPAWEIGEIAYLVPADEGHQKAALPSSTAIDAGGTAKAMEIIAKVYESLEKNDVKAAYKRFDRERRFLKVNLMPEAYTLLDETVTSAYKTGGRKK